MLAASCQCVLQPLCIKCDAACANLLTCFADTPYACSSQSASAFRAADLHTLAKLIPAQSRMVLNPATLEEPSQAGNAPEMDLAMVPTSNIRPGDIVRVLPGERMPVDGDIVEGKCSVDESMLTGESVPVPKSKGQQVCCSRTLCTCSNHVLCSSLDCPAYFVNKLTVVT